MANRRMLAKSISISDQVAQLDLFAALLFTWMIAHADDWGVLPGSPTKLRALVIPQLGAAIEQVIAALDAMEAQSLIWRYEWTDGTPYLQFRTWEQHQDIHKRTAPRSPRYCDLPGNSPDSAPSSPHVREVPGNDGKFPPNLTKPKRREENLTSRATGVVIPAREEMTTSQRPEIARAHATNSATGHSPSRLARDHPLRVVISTHVEPPPRIQRQAEEWERSVCELADAGYTAEQILAGVAKYRREMSSHIPLTLRALIKHAPRLMEVSHGSANGANGHDPGSLAGLAAAERARADAIAKRDDEEAAQRWQWANSPSSDGRARPPAPAHPDESPRPTPGAAAIAPDRARRPISRPATGPPRRPGV